MCSVSCGAAGPSRGSRPACPALGPCTRGRSAAAGPAVVLQWGCILPSAAALGPVSSGGGHHVRPAGCQQRGQQTRNARSGGLGTAVVGGMQGVRLGRGLFFWGPASQVCTACSATFLSFGPAEQEDLEAGGLIFTFLHLCWREGTGITAHGLVCASASCGREQRHP